MATTAPISDLDAAQNALNEARNAPAEVPAAQPANEVAAPVVENRPFTLQTGPDGNVELKFQTGETFKGSHAEVLEKLAEADANTRVYARDWKTKATQYEQQIQQLSAALNPQPQPQQPQIDPAASALLDMLAPALGYASGEAMRNDLGGMREVTVQQRSQQIAGAFFQQNPDFTPSQGNAQVLEGFMQQNHFDLDNPLHWSAAHRMIAASGSYPDKQTAAPVNAAAPARPNIPPTLTGSTAMPSGVTEQQISDMSLADLGAMMSRMRRQV